MDAHIDLHAPTATLSWSPEFVGATENASEDFSSTMVQINPPPSGIETITERDPDVSINSDIQPMLLVPGDRLPNSRIEIEARIGMGATAVVFRGRHVDLDRPLAIKVLKRGVSWVEARERFLAEARLTSDLESPYVVDVVDFGTLPDGRMWSAMELLDGQPLASEIEEGPLSLERSIALLRMACKGLDAAHAAGVVHRDIKPDNLMLVHKRGSERLVIVDFGIATTDGHAANKRCGTPRYMAPEQIRGASLDGRTDVYALGCCAYEMLTGKPLVGGDTVEDVLEAHLHGARPDFSAHAHVPSALQSVVERCLRTDPEDRYASAAELEAALCEAQLAADLRCPTDTLPLPEIEDLRRRSDLARRFARRPRYAPMRSLGVGAAAVLASMVVGMGWARGEDQLPMASAPQSDTALVAGSVGPQDSPAFSPLSPTDTAALASSMGGAARSDAQPRPDAKQDAQPQASTPPRSDSERSAGRQGDDATATPSWLDRQRARAEVRRGRRAARAGNPADARGHYEKALALDARDADAHAGLAELDSDLGRHRNAIRHARTAVRISPQDPDHRIRLGDSYLASSQRDKAKSQYQRAANLGSLSAKRRIRAL